MIVCMLCLCGNRVFIVFDVWNLLMFDLVLIVLVERFNIFCVCGIGLIVVGGVGGVGMLRYVGVSGMVDFGILGKMKDIF